MRNSEIAAALRELGILYELDGADRFRVLAYKEAARTIQDSPVSIALRVSGVIRFVGASRGPGAAS